jgi:hypothetical protein
LYPASGSPPYKYLSKIYPRVCTLCFDLYKLLETNPYFMKHQTEYEEERDRRKRTISGKPSGGWSVA